MKVFLDTNIIIDLYSQRENHYIAASQIFDLAVRGEIEIVVSSFQLMLLSQETSILRITTQTS